MINLRKVVLMAGIVLMAVTVSCSKKSEGPDKTKPTFVVVKPTNGQSYMSTQSIAFEATFTDNKALGTATITLSNLKSASGIEDPWTPAPTEITLIGKSQTVRQNLFGGPIPVDIWTGGYVITVALRDAAGNEAVSQDFQITID